MHVRRYGAFAGILAILAVAGCGAGTATLTAATRAATTHPGGSPAAPAGSRAEAMAYAEQLLSALRLPPGTRPAHVRQVPIALGGDGPVTPVPDTVVLHEVLATSESMSQVYAFFLAHHPRGTVQFGFGSGSDSRGHLIEDDVEYMPPDLPPGIASASVATATGPASDGSILISVGSDVEWYPARSAAEHIDPAAYQQVTVLVTRYGQTVSHQTRTFTAAAVIARLADYLNVLPAVPDIVHSCAPAMTAYRLTFTGHGRPDAVVGLDGCGSDGIIVGGVTQPGLRDTGPGLVRTLGALMGQK